MFKHNIHLFKILKITLNNINYNYEIKSEVKNPQLV